ncbi:MAG TPA: alpha/beta fold hydrolase [Stenotrophomonas sp.]|jgi:pimeloyl-ACP methyl ester carboxylesterase
MSSKMQAGRLGVSSPGATTRWRAIDLRAKVVRLGMRRLSWLSPSLAARVMDRLWFRAPRTHPSAGALACLAAGRRSTLLLQGRPVAVWEWGGQGPCVLLVHGWGGHGGQLHAFVAPLLAAGLRVVAFDAPAHGASGASTHGRRRVTFLQFSAALQALAERMGPLAGVIAHSGGCTSVALAMRQGWRAPARLVFVAPFCEPAAAIDAFARQLGVDGGTVARFSARAERWLGLAWRDLDIAEVPVERNNAKLLVLHDATDREVPIAQSQRLVAAWPDAALLTTIGSGHRRILGQPEMVEAGVAFLVAGCPSTATQSDRAPGYLPADSRVDLDLAYEAIDRFWQREA